jgi:putative ABC transport system permease protein
MKKTARLDALRNIQNRFVSWLSMATIVFIGTSIILGLYFSCTALESTGFNYIEEHNFKDIDLACSLGIREQDIDNIQAVSGIKDAEGMISLAGQLSSGDKNAGCYLFSVTDRISVPYVEDGRLPTEVDECGICRELAKKLDVSLGDEITVYVTTSRLSNTLLYHNFTVTGIVGHPDYMSPERVDFCLLPRACFDTSGSAFDYTNLLIDVDVPDSVKMTSKQYTKEVNRVRKEIEDMSDELTKSRMENLAKELDAEYDKAEAEANRQLKEAKDKIDAGQKEFDDKIAKSKAVLDDAETQLNEGKEKAKRELAEGAKKIRDGEAEYNQKIADGQAQLDQAQKDMEKELQDAKWKLFAGFLELDEAQKLLNEKEEEYRRGLERLEAGKVELDEGMKKFQEALEQADEKVNDGTIRSIEEGLQEIADDPDVSEETRQLCQSISERLESVLGKDPIEKCDMILNIYDDIFEDVDPRIKEIIDDLVGVEDFRDKLQQLKDARQKVSDGQREYEDGKRRLEEARQQLDQGWYSLQKGKEQLAEGEAELARKEPEARQKLADAKVEFEQKKADGAKQIEDAKKTYAAKKKEAEEEIAKHEKELEDGKAEFESQKEKAEKELEDARKQYDDAEKEARDKLSEAKLEIDKAKNMECKWFAQTRDANLYYMEFTSYCDIMFKVSMVFIPIFAVIVVIVCFFTMAIIVEEQSKQIGTCKAFGMYESEIMRKYIVFGASGALFGAILGVIGAFIIEKLLINTMRDNLAFSLEGTGHNIPFIILLPVAEVMITVVAVLWSCHIYIKCSAVGLINGNEPAARYRKKEGFKLSGSLYATLIFNNLLTDIGREVVSVVTIVMCVFIVGFGIDIKLAYEGALRNQMYNIWQYDLTLTESGTITDEEKEAVKKALSSFDTLYLPITAGVITDGEAQVLTSIICVDDKEEFGRFYILRSPSGKDMGISDDGVIVTKEMEDKNALSAGSTVDLTVGGPSPSEVSVKGVFMLYAGKTMIMTKDYYKDRFESDPVANTYYIKAGSANEKELQASLSELPGVSSVELTKNLRDRNMAVVNLYNAVVVIVILFSVLLSFMILLNLSNILVAHRMKEILTMRVNGFSNAHVIGYLVREVMLIEVLSIAIALAFGMPLTSIIIKNLETDAFMFVRQPFALAWIGSVLINLLFSVTINFIAFRNVNKVPLTDINRY